MLDDLTAEMGECAPHGPSGRTVELICATVSKPSARAMILLELASLGHVDQEYASQERELLAAISEQWGIAPITLFRIEQWAANRIALSAEAIEVIQEILAETGIR